MYLIEVSDEELRLLRAALHGYLDDFTHEQADLVREIKALIERIPQPSLPHPEAAPDTSVTEL